MHCAVWLAVLFSQRDRFIVFSAIEKLMAAASGQVDFFVGILHCIRLSMVHGITTK
jgi:hypothetical protein